MPASDDGIGFDVPSFPADVMAELAQRAGTESDTAALDAPRRVESGCTQIAAWHRRS